MANPSKFSKSEQLLLVSIPYRVGIWISMVDDNTKTKFDDKQERKALETAILDLAGRSKKMPFAANLMNQVQSSESLWPVWEQQAAEALVLTDLEQALALCADKRSGAELKQYKWTVWQIAIIVAQAYGEHIDPDNEMHVDRFFAWVGSSIGRPQLGKNPENMSAKEKTALKKLRAVLKG